MAQFSTVKFLGASSLNHYRDKKNFYSTYTIRELNNYNISSMCVYQNGQIRVAAFILEQQLILMLMAIGYYKFNNVSTIQKTLWRF